ncbi:LacI family transcriptional regulator [Actinoplanes sp. KI2]|uniref:LacI family DNA-binding transcriptional regulator n=1 Tax=Actinoplanes sp. KI2 TaxID=2983315 RepID=UPI0021D5AE72|nr:LacI family DNA-binding transcriptional regulator [Actinoplanes sp. KI2]MCU7727681.1 LacI family transcriptional regulator [Actinoplanes sp. KI2]
MTALTDVARRAGVSPATASRVLSGSGPASADARARVRSAADALGYRTHPVARMFARGRGTRIVLAIRDANRSILSDPFVSRAAAAVAEVADTAGLGVALRRLPLDCETDLAELAADRSVAAVLLAGHDHRLPARLPRALHGRSATIGAAGADVDSGAGIGALLRHLHATGRRRIAMVAGPRWVAAARTPLDAYATFVADAGLPVRTVAGDFTTARGRVAARRILRTWPDTDAIVAVSDATALGVLDALSALGVRVPGDVAVTGFDDSPLAAAARLTSATHPVERIAAYAADAALRGGEARRLFPSRPKLRASCGGTDSTA